jgi:heptosyltransferase-2
MGPKRVAQQLRPRRYEAALLLTNSFSTALITRVAGIPRRVGYERDGRGLLLTQHLTPDRRREVEPFNRSNTAPNAWAPVPACVYYERLTRHFLGASALPPGQMQALELSVTGEQRLHAEALLRRAGVLDGAGVVRPFAVLNPGGNNDAKRWPAERFAAVGDHLHERHGLIVAINGAPGERELTDEVCSMLGAGVPHANLAELGMSLGALKGVLSRASILVTNDTGPRHIAAALGVPVVTMFGPTDRRWTTIPFADEAELDADPSLPDEEVANDWPDRCRVDRIGVDRVIEACDGLLGVGSRSSPPSRRSTV